MSLQHPNDDHSQEGGELGVVGRHTIPRVKRMGCGWAVVLQQTLNDLVHHFAAAQGGGDKAATDTASTDHQRDQGHKRQDRHKRNES
eukprot:CAMPEP_0204297860 /NCGR_PEP_ID=MMETSP0468-20130131/73989_1 /ASSEMBLY_ACC=CAM_ASM_000383 /TAXON_ID=2969 /ORGANISM="Oxyrrhis marina" /LENGTH=86 /DNA_ID=CAMNT_0051276695 /DNA_START=456 /DNA_END=716 /DNA_ORIENTATION=+